MDRSRLFALLARVTFEQCAAVVRVDPERRRIEVELQPGFRKEDLAAVRSLPGRRWDPKRRVWTAPGTERPLEWLIDQLGPTRVQIRKAAPDPPPAPDPLDAVREALLVRGYSPRTRKVYLGHVRRFLTWCGGGSLTLPSDPEASVHAYIIHLVEERGVSRACHNQVVSALRFVCETVLGRPALAMRVPRPRREHRLPEVLSPDEVARLLAKVRNLKHRAMLMLLYSAGLRVGELVRLRPDDLDLERGLLRVRQGKGRRDRYTLLADKAVEAVRTYRRAFPPSRWLFPGARPDRPIGTRSVQRVVAGAAEASGIEKRVTTHTLRHSFATHLLERGTNLRIIQELLGHRTTRTTQIYTHVAKSTLEAIRSPLDDVE